MSRLAFIAVLGWMVASPSMACTLMISPPRPGETLDQAAVREERADQIMAWEEADAVFLARVVEVAEVANGGVRYTFLPIAGLHGSAPPSRLSTTGFASLCYDDPEWSQGELAIVYADRISLNEYWLRWGQWQEIKAVRPAAAFDPRIARALRASANRLRASSL